MHLDFATPESVGMSPAGVERAKQYAERVSDELGGTGGATVVARDGKVIGEWYWGKTGASREASPFDQDTMVPLVSVTKGLTATALALMVESGQLWLDDPAYTFIDELGAGQKEKITVRHLATHSSGFDDGAPTFYKAWQDGRESDHPYEPYVRRALELDLVFEPGSWEIYSNPATALLGEVIYRASGKRVDEIIEQSVLEPLGLTRLGWDFDDELSRDIAPCVGLGSAPEDYGRTRTGTPEARADRSVWAGIIGNARDLCAFGQLLLRRGSLGGVRVMSPLAVEMMTTCQMPEPARQSFPHRGLFWWIKATPDTPELGHLIPSGTYCHGGGAHSVLVVMPALDIVAVMLRNRHGDPPGFIYERDYPVFMDLVAAAVQEH